jgi:phospholipase A1
MFLSPGGATMARVLLFILLALGPPAMVRAAEVCTPPAVPSVFPVFPSAQPSPDPDPVPLDDTPLEQRLHHEMLAKKSLFSILPHKTNYLLPMAYNTSPNTKVYADASGNTESLDKSEVKFQLSIKAPLWENIFGSSGALFVAYSQIAFWQAYNSKSSAPFREINFEPEAFLAFAPNYKLLGVTSKIITVGFNHQSNGRSKPLSRSWNRIDANFVLGSDNTYVSLRPWFRIPESSGDDDNPHMERYYGYGELFIVHKFKQHTLGLMVRNNLRTEGNKGAVQVDWSFPLYKKLRGYVQYFNGYGENLADYNHVNNRLGVGVMLTDWL